jgi:hypothetical protein
LENTCREIDYRLDVLRATKAAHVEVYWCVVKKTSWIAIWEKICLYCTYSSFLVINVCNQGNNLCSPCINIYMYTEMCFILTSHVGCWYCDGLRRRYDLKCYSKQSLLYKSLAFIMSALCDYFPRFARSLTGSIISFAYHKQ